MKRIIMLFSLIALVAFMPTVSSGQVGAMDVQRIIFDILVDEERGKPVTTNFNAPWAAFGISDDFTSKLNIVSKDTMNATNLELNNNTDFGWLIDTTNTTITMPDSLGGILKFTPTAAALNGFVMQWNKEMWLTTGTAWWYEARIASTNWDVTDTFIGMGRTSTTITDSLDSTADGVYFWRDSLDVMRAISLKDTSNLNHFTMLETDTTIVPAALWAATADTYYEFSIWYDGNSTIRYFIDDVSVATHTTTAHQPSDELLTPTVAYRRLTAVAGNIILDYVDVQQLK